MDYILHVLVLAGMYAIYAMSLNLELGYAGLYNFGHVAFFGVGAYVSALLTLGGWPVEPSLVAAALLAGLAGAVFAWGSLRLTGDYFGMATLAFAEMFRLLALNERWLTRGPLGLPGIPRPGWMGQGMSGLPHFLVFELVVAAGVWWLLRRLTASPFGRALKVIREDEQVAQALGKNLLSFRVRAVDHPVKLAFHSALFEWIPYFKECTLSWDIAGNTRFDPQLDSFSFHCAMAPMLFVTLDICRDDYDFALAVKMIEVWRKVAGLMLEGDYYPLTPYHRAADQWVARQFDRPEEGRGFIQGIRLPAAPEETFTVYPKGLQAEATYRLENPETGEVRELTGAALQSQGFCFALSKRAGAIWLYQRKGCKAE